MAYPDVYHQMIQETQESILKYKHFFLEKANISLTPLQNKTTYMYT